MPLSFLMCVFALTGTVSKKQRIPRNGHFHASEDGF